MGVHITIAVFDEYAAEFEPKFREFVRNLPPLSLYFPNLGIFPKPEGVVFLGAVLSQELATVHRAFHDQFADFLVGPRSYYQPGHRLPHCTLAIGLTEEEIPQAVRLFANERLPLETPAGAVGLVEFPTHRELATFPIKIVRGMTTAEVF